MGFCCDSDWEFNKEDRVSSTYVDGYKDFGVSWGILSLTESNL